MIREGVPTPIPILEILAHWDLWKMIEVRYLVFFTYSTASLNLICLAKSFATAASLD